MDSCKYLDLVRAERQEYLQYLISIHKEESYPIITTEIEDRISLELNEIAKQDLSLEFLTAMEINEILHKNNASYPHCVGTAVGSVVAYILGITWHDAEPIKHGLIFERCFSEYDKKRKHFSFFAMNYEKQALVATLTERGYSVNVCHEEDAEILTVNGIQFNIQDSVRDFSYGDIISCSKKAVFQEDYMHMLHFMAGYSYAEVNEIRKIAAKMNKVRLSEYRLDFVQRCSDKLSEEEADMQFDTIVLELRYATCKAYLLSTMAINAYFEYNGNGNHYKGNIDNWFATVVKPLLDNPTFIALASELFGLCNQTFFPNSLTDTQREEYVRYNHLHNCSRCTLLQMSYDIYTDGAVDKLGEKLSMLDTAHHRKLLTYLLDKQYVFPF